MAIYYFDGSDVAATDPNANWANDANAFDGSKTTQSAGTAQGSTASNYLMAEGTNAPGTGASIDTVLARIYASTSATSVMNAAIYTDGLGELLGTASAGPSAVSTVPGASIILAVPTGGWTWAKIQALEVKCYITAANFADIYQVEIEVNPTLGTHFYLKQGFQ